MTSNADIARAMAENMAKAAVPLYGKKMRLPDRGAIIGIIKEFRRLLDLVYIGNWILNSTREKDRFEDYDILQEKLFAQCAKNGMNALISRWQGHIFPSPAYENGGIHEAIAYYEDLLAHEEKILGVIKEEMREISKKFGDKRRTEISQVEKDLDVEDLIADEDMVVTITHTGYVKRIPVAAYRAQKRGGKGVSGVNLKEDDVIDEMFIASTHEYVLFFSSKGKVYRLKVHELPVGTRQARGTAIVNLLPFEEGEKIASVISCREFPADEYLMFATKSGMVKKTVMSAYDRSRRDGLIAINLRDDDALLNVRRVREGDKIILATTAGKAIMFSEEQVRATGRDTSGVRGIGLKDGVSVLGMEVTNGNGDLFVITERGYGKRTPVADYPEQNRGGQGVYTIQMTERKGNLAAMKTVGPQHELFIVTEGATVIRVKTDEISQTGRATQGVKMMTVDDNDRVCAVARMTAAKEKPEGEGAEAAADTEEAPVDLGDGNDMPEDLLDE